MNKAVEIIFDYLNLPPQNINNMTDNPVGIRHRAADTTCADELPDSEPQHLIEEGIKHTLKWYIEARDKEYVRENLETLLHGR